MIEIEFEGLGVVERFTGYAEAWWKTIPLDMLGAAMVDEAIDRIENDDRAPDGSAWDPWSDSYALTRGPGDKLLKSEGDLADSLSHRVRGGDRLELLSSVPYGRIHQKGNTGSRPMPQRQYAGLSDSLEVELNRTMPADFERRWRQF